MGHSNSINAYADVIPVLDRALATDKGTKITFQSKSAAYRFRQRCCKYRALDRKANFSIYEPHHPLFKVSTYDKLVMRLVQEGENWIVLLEIIRETALNEEPL